MSKKTKNYNSISEYKTDRVKMHSNGFRILEMSRLDKKPLSVLYVNGSDDPANIPKPPKRRITQAQLFQELAEERGVELI